MKNIISIRNIAYRKMISLEDVQGEERRIIYDQEELCLYYIINTVDSRTNLHLVGGRCNDPWPRCVTLLTTERKGSQWIYEVVTVW